MGDTNIKATGQVAQTETKRKDLYHLMFKSVISEKDQNTLCGPRNFIWLSVLHLNLFLMHVYNLQYPVHKFVLNKTMLLPGGRFFSLFCTCP